jgi:Pyruvate/2-oxoacid:ferredoxin oxidoreductase delta subunit
MNDKKYTYRMSNTKASSIKYGNCEVCGEYCNDVFIMTEMKEYSFIYVGKKYSGKSNQYTKFGHESCLKSLQKVEVN